MIRKCDTSMTVLTLESVGFDLCLFLCETRHPRKLAAQIFEKNTLQVYSIHFASPMLLGMAVYPKAA